MEWEYNTIYYELPTFQSRIVNEIDEFLNKQGKGGWELVSTNTLHIHLDTILLILKRPKKTEPGKKENTEL